jgi:hypothetical protein
MRSLNDPRQGSFATVLLHLESGARLFGNQALTVKPVTPLSLPLRDICIRCRPTHPSPSAR